MVLGSSARVPVEFDFVGLPHCGQFPERASTTVPQAHMMIGIAVPPEPYFFSLSHERKKNRRFCLILPLEKKPLPDMPNSSGVSTPAGFWRQSRWFGRSSG
jgi:hypothetical protein